MRSVYKVFLACIIAVFLMKFVPAPHIDYAYWDPTLATEGDPVKLIVSGPGLEGREITFQIYEKNKRVPDKLITNDPLLITYHGSSSYAIWIAEYHKDDEPGESDPPEYYFAAEVVGEPAEYGMNSSNRNVDDPKLLRVSKSVSPIICGDGKLEGDEECDDGEDNGKVCIPGYGLGENCKYCSDECEEVVVSGGYCGDGNIDSPHEVCDNSGLNGVECVVPVGGSSCVYCSDDCTREITITSSVCGDGVCNEPDENCNNCEIDCGKCMDVAPLPVFGNYSFLISAALVLSIYFLVSVVQKRRREENLNKNLKKKKTFSKNKGKKKIV